MTAQKWLLALLSLLIALVVGLGILQVAWMARPDPEAQESASEEVLPNGVCAVDYRFTCEAVGITSGAALSGVLVRGEAQNSRFYLPDRLGGDALLRIKPGDYHFGEGVDTLTIPGSVIEILDGALQESGIETVILEDGCRKVGCAALPEDLLELWLPESIRICHAFAELQEDGSFTPITLSKKSVTLHFAGDEAAFKKIDFGCPLPDGVEIVYRSAYTP